MAHARVALFGAAGYTGLELAKLLPLHPELSFVCAASDTHAGKPVAQLAGGASTLSFVTTVQAHETPADIALLAVPHDAAPAMAAQIRARGTKVVDLSNAHRASAEAVYGLTSWFADEVVGASLVANPGCYATGIITAVAPLVRHGLIEREIIVAAGSGVTGAGKSKDEALSLGELHDNVRAYKVLKHQHVPEIERALARVAGSSSPAAGSSGAGSSSGASTGSVGAAGAKSPRVILTTHLLPIARGIFATITVRLLAPRTSDELTRLFREDYAGDPTVRVFDTPEEVSLRRVVGTNETHVGVASNGEHAIVTASIDNLLKGAAGQAIENVNIMLGLPRITGLLHLARHG
ncbi:MAG: Asd/ArgC dimerization domain-containing protein [Kofleriaceae bacterium]